MDVQLTVSLCLLAPQAPWPERPRSAVRQPPLPTHLAPALLLLLVILLSPARAQMIGGGSVSSGPLDAKRLLQFKALFTNGHTVLSSWVEGTEPCKQWEGVWCTNSSYTEPSSGNMYIMLMINTERRLLFGL